MFEACWMLWCDFQRLLLQRKTQKGRGATNANCFVLKSKTIFSWTVPIVVLFIFIPLLFRWFLFRRQFLFYTQHAAYTKNKILEDNGKEEEKNQSVDRKIIIKACEVWVSQFEWNHFHSQSFSSVLCSLFLLLFCGLFALSSRFRSETSITYNSGNWNYTAQRVESKLLAISNAKHSENPSKNPTTFRTSNISEIGVSVCMWDACAPVKEKTTTILSWTCHFSFYNNENKLTTARFTTEIEYFSSATLRFSAHSGESRGMLLKSKREREIFGSFGDIVRNWWNCISCSKCAAKIQWMQCWRDMNAYDSSWYEWVSERLWKS